MADDEEYHVAPNLRQGVFVRFQRIRIGDKHFAKYQHPAADKAFFHLWLPPLGGTVNVELDAQGSVEIHFNGRRLARATGTVVRARVTSKDSGYLDIHVAPEHVGVKATLTFDGWPVDADRTPLVPWNFWYYPYNPDPKEKFPSREVQISAVTNFDKLAGYRKPRAARWEQKFHCRDKAGGWEGHCDPGAYASVVFKPPTGDRRVGGVVFTNHERELLAAEWLGRDLRTVNGWSSGPGGIALRVKRNPKKVEGQVKPVEQHPFPPGWVTHLLRPEESSRPRDDQLADRYLRMLREFWDWSHHEVMIRNEARDLAKRVWEIEDAFGKAGVELWAYLVDELSGDARPIVGDFGPLSDDASQVWNHAIVRVVTRVEERWSADPPDPMKLDGVLEIDINLDARPQALGEAASDPANRSAAEVVKGKPVPTPGHHKKGVYRFAFDFRPHAHSGRPQHRWLSARLDGDLAFAPRVMGSPGRPAPDPDLHPEEEDEERERDIAAEMKRSGNPYVTDLVLALVELRGRYR